MPQRAAPHPQADADRLDAATDHAIAACDGDARLAVKALIVANEYLAAEVKALQAPFQPATPAASSNRCRAIGRIGTIEGK